MNKDTENNIPNDWNIHAYSLWAQGQHSDAINAVVTSLNEITEKKPKGLLIQLAYYISLTNDFASASDVFKHAFELYPEDSEILLNLAISCSNNNNFQEAISYITQLLRKEPKSFDAWDCLSKCYHKVNNDEKAARAGTNSLLIKDSLNNKADPNWNLPSQNINQFVADKKNVVAFSLWGNGERYIFGALRNLLLAPDLYPDWEIWIYIDGSVPAPFINIFKYLGATILLQPEGQTRLQKLSWRFRVANDPNVGYFLIRDIDSVFSLRECNAVQEWLDSDKWFHIIRDHWTHTDLVLAGLWGGISGVLPNLDNLLNEYRPNAVNAPNIDQWFLRDKVWRYIQMSCLMHDRCFSLKGAIPLPGPEPKSGKHIGSNEYAENSDLQRRVLSPWIGGGNRAI